MLTFTPSQRALAGLLLTALAVASPRPDAALATLLAAGSGAAVGEPLAPLTAAVTLLAWALVGWLSAVAALLLLGRLPGMAGALAGRAVRRAAPAVVRRALQAALGLGVSVSVLASVAGPAAADHGGLHAQVGAATAGPALPLPAVAGETISLDWPLTEAHSQAPRRADQVRPHADAQPQQVAPPHQAALVTVRPGDSLWRIAAARLPQGASAARIAQTWPTWWAANRGVIGADPDLLHPGTHLTAPRTP